MTARTPSPAAPKARALIAEMRARGEIDLEKIVEAAARAHREARGARPGATEGQHATGIAAAFDIERSSLFSTIAFIGYIAATVLATLVISYTFWQLWRGRKRR